MRMDYFPQPTDRKTRSEATFSMNLRKLIADGRLSLNKICEISGVAKSVAHGWVNGVTPRDLTAVAKLSDALNLEFRELLLGERESARARKSQGDTTLSEKELFDNFCQLLFKKMQQRGKSSD